MDLESLGPLFLTALVLGSFVAILLWTNRVTRSVIADVAAFARKLNWSGLRPVPWYRWTDRGIEGDFEGTPVAAHYSPRNRSIPPRLTLVARFRFRSRVTIRSKLSDPLLIPRLAPKRIDVAEAPLDVTGDDRALALRLLADDELSSAFRHERFHRLQVRRDRVIVKMNLDETRGLRTLTGLGIRGRPSEGEIRRVATHAWKIVRAVRRIAV